MVPYRIVMGPSAVPPTSGSVIAVRLTIKKGIFILLVLGHTLPRVILSLTHSNQNCASPPPLGLSLLSLVVD